MIRRRFRCPEGAEQIGRWHLSRPGGNATSLEEPTRCRRYKGPPAVELKSFGGRHMKRASFVRFGKKTGSALMVLLLGACVGRGQEPAPGAAKAQASALLEALGELQTQVRGLQSTLNEVRAQATRSREEVVGLRQELQEARAQLASLERDLRGGRAQPTIPATAAATSQEPTGERLAKVEEEQQLLSAKIDEQHQTKVESASKYRVRLSGIVLLNVFGNRGSVDNQDVPSLARSRRALDSPGDFGATLRQSSLGLEIFGPKFGGARTSADVQFDFFGGFPNALDGVTSGLVRLRTAGVRLDWSRTSIVAGQDAPFFSPLSPTSMASLGLPAFSYSGNLWTWTPQIRLERRVDLADNSSISLQGGILDPLSGEPPYQPFYRSPQAGEKSRQPAYAARIAWTHAAFGRPLAVGVGGYYSRQNWGLCRNVDAWAGTADWDLPLGRWFALTGEFYRGRALGGLGGGIGRSVLFNGPLTDARTSVLGLHSQGGWAQLKFKPVEKLEFNGAFGQDNPEAEDLRYFSQGQSTYSPSLARNRSALVNFIYRPRSALLFSVEYRRMRTFEIYESGATADHLNLGIGVLF